MDNIGYVILNALSSGVGAYGEAVQANREQKNQNALKLYELGIKHQQEQRAAAESQQRLALGILQQKEAQGRIEAQQSQQQISALQLKELTRRIGMTPEDRAKEDALAEYQKKVQDYAAQISYMRELNKLGITTTGTTANKENWLNPFTPQQIFNEAQQEQGNRLANIGAQIGQTISPLGFTGPTATQDFSNAPYFNATNAQDSSAVASAIPQIQNLMYSAQQVRSPGWLEASVLHPHDSLGIPSFLVPKELSGGTTTPEPRPMPASWKGTKEQWLDYLRKKGEIK